MAFRSSIKLNDSLMQKRLDNLVNKEAKRWISAGIKVMKEIRVTAMREWYGRVGGKSGLMEQATQYKHYAKTNPETKAKRIYIVSYIDINMLEGMNAFPKARSWMEAHSRPDWTYRGKKAIPPRAPIARTHDTSSEYVMDLQWNKGILGLPQRETMTGTGWSNSNFKNSKPPVLRATDDLKNEWADRVLQIIKSRG